MKSIMQGKTQLLDWRDDVQVVVQGYPLSQQILRTDVSGMPLEWVDYREAARLYHTEQVAYTCGTLLYRLYRRNLRAHGVAHHRGRQFDHRDAGPHRQSRKFARRRLYAAAQQPNAVPPRRLSVPVLRRALSATACCRATMSRRSAAAATDTWSNVVSACRRCNNAKASRTPEQAGMQLLAVPFTPTYAEYIFLKGRRVSRIRWNT
jgi:5-methylcytosine-specific restriction endonuclease McrA